MLKRWSAEAMGTAWLVLGGCGSAVLALGFPDIGIGLLGVSVAFGLSLATAMWTFGSISGGHFNPAVTLGMAIAGRFPLRDVAGYLVAQVVGAVAGAALVYLIASGRIGFDLAGGLDANGYAEHSPGAYGPRAGFLAEVLFTFLLVSAYLAALRLPLHPALAPAVVGLTLVLVNLVALPVTNGSFNPARSTGPAVLVRGWALHQLWLFWVAPLLGGVGAALLDRLLRTER